MLKKEVDGIYIYIHVLDGVIDVTILPRARPEGMVGHQGCSLNFLFLIKNWKGMMFV